MVRVRSDNSSVPAVSATASTKYWGNTVPSSFSEGTYVSVGETGTTTMTTTDVVTPEYKKLSARGVIINNDFHKKTETYTPPQSVSYSFAEVYKSNEDPERWQGSEYSGQRIPPSSWLQDFLVYRDEEELSDIESFKAQAVTSAHANVDLSQMDVLVTAAESGKTVSSVTAILYRVAKILKAMKSLDYKYLQRQISKRELEDRYMELRYALRPLMYDMNGVLNTAQEIEKGIRSKHVRQTFRAGKSFSNSRSDYVETVDSVRRRIARSSHLDVQIHAGVLTDVYQSMSSLTGATKIFESAWELVPFSFIVDWFVNVGDTIAAWTPKPGIRELASWVTVRTTSTRINRLVETEFLKTKPSNAVTGKWHWDMGPAEKRQVISEVTRTANPNLRIFPATSVRLNPLKLTDLGIILQRLR